MKKELIGILIFLILIASAVLPATGTIIIEKSSISTFYDGNILYVGGSGPNNYSRIQDAIDNASNSDTVYVYDESSPYYEHLKVDVTINLVGENRDTTIIDGNGERKDVVEITAAQVVISGFTIQNSSQHEYYVYAGINVKGDADNVTITGNNITKNVDTGIGICTSNNVVTDNLIINNNRGGIYIWQWPENNIYSDYNIITGNTLISNNVGCAGIELESVCNNIIENNTIIKCGKYGILLEHASSASCQNTIRSNNISNHQFQAIHLDTYCQYNDIRSNIISGRGISLDIACNNNIISGNILNNGGDAIFIHDSNNNIVIGNIISDVTEGILLHSTIGTVVQDNFIKHCTYEGIDLESHSSACIDNVIFNNTIDNCHRYGMNIRGTSKTIIQDNKVNNTLRGINLLYDNTVGRIQGNIISNTSYGMYFEGEVGWGAKIRNYTINCNTLINNEYGMYHYYSEDNTIFHNNFINNTQNAFETFDNTWYSSWVEEGNYWSDFDEPGEGAWDNDSDGIVDSPYTIPGLDNQDLFPLMQLYSNNPPLKPSRPSGDVSGKPWKIYEYSSSTTDPENDQIYYMFDWDDGTNSGWVGPYASGATGNAKHIWGKKGTYSVRVKAMDNHGEESLWSDSLPVTMPKNYQASSQQSNNQQNSQSLQSNPSPQNQQSNPSGQHSSQQINQLFHNLIYNLILRHQTTR